MTLGRITILLASGLTFTGCSFFDDMQSTPPAPLEIVALRVTPSEGEAPLEVLIDWEILDPAGANLTCTLDLGDGTTEVITNCGVITSVFHAFTDPGGYVIVLKTTEGDRHAGRSVPVRVDEPQDDENEGDEPEATTPTSRAHQRSTRI